MRFNPLGRTGMQVSEICLGTMTWGSQNSEAEGHAQMDYAVAHGVNFFDTAEMYPTTPLAKETVGLTEEIVGSWLKASGKRQDIIVATKIAGPGRSWIRDGVPISGDEIRKAIDLSLTRLDTDYIDLYQLHWPNRGHYHFRQAWNYQPERQPPREAVIANLREILEAIGEAHKAGKVRAFGLSNDTVWGTMQYLKLADEHGLPRVASIQNEYNLLYHQHDLDFAEVAHHEDIGLLAFSPLAGGLLSGKYLGGAIPAGSRASINGDLGGRLTPHQEPAVAEFVEVAKKHGLDPARMSLAFCLTRPFMTSVIVGATTMEQLRMDISAKDLVLDDAVIRDIRAVIRKYPMAI